MSEPVRMRRVVIAGGGFARFHARAHTIPAGEWPLAEARGRRSQVEIVLVSPAEYFLSLPLLPEVPAGILDLRPHRRAPGGPGAGCPADTGHGGRGRCHQRRVVLADPVNTGLAGLPPELATIGIRGARLSVRASSGQRRTAKR
jgi:hypothetical protein